MTLDMAKEVERRNVARKILLKYYRCCLPISITDHDMNWKNLFNRFEYHKISFFIYYEEIMRRILKSCKGLIFILSYNTKSAHAVHSLNIFKVCVVTWSADCSNKRIHTKSSPFLFVLKKASIWLSSHFRSFVNSWWMY